VIIAKVEAGLLKNKISTYLALALIYGANIGGMGSMIGASSNIYFLGYIELQKLPGKENINFMSWLVFGLPLSFVLLIISKFVLGIGMKKTSFPNINFNISDKSISPKLKKYFLFLFLNIIIIMILSAIQFIKKPANIISVFNIVDVIFLIYLLLFVFFATIFPRGSFSWGKIFINIFDILINIILFPLIYLSQLINEIKARFNLISLNNIFEKFLNKTNKSSRKNNRSTYISINRIYDDLPFLGISFMGIVIFLLYIILKIGDNPLTPELDGYVYLIIKDSLCSIISPNISTLLLLIVIVPVSIFFTEIISNTTIIIIMFSLISTIAPTLNINPIFLMLAVTVSSTAAFMSPIASPVNAVTYGSIKGISLKEMFYKGLLLNILSSIWIIIVFFYFLSS